MTLEIFTAVLLLHVVCLPCVYLWILRRVRRVDPEGWDEHLSRVSGENNITTKEVMNALETVKFIIVEGSYCEGKQGDSKSQTKVKVISNTEETKRVEACWRLRELKIMTRTIRM